MKGEALSRGTAFERLIARLAPSHPFYADFTIVALDDRSRDALHHYLHRHVGGLMPRIVPFEQYKKDRLQETKGLAAMEEEEAFIRFHLFCRSKDKTKGPEETEQLFTFLRLLSRFSVSLEELRKLDRLTGEQWERIEGNFSLRDEYRRHLANDGRSYLPFEEEFLRTLDPGEKEFFVGLPLLTPAHEVFLSRIPGERLFVPEALFGQHFPEKEPEYETAYHLVARYGLPLRKLSAQKISFSEVSDRSALAALIAEEVDQFLRIRRPGDQMAILLLDEELSFYLWQFLFASRSGEVNFSPWLPFHQFGPAYQLSAAVSSGEDFLSVKETLVKKIRTAWTVLDPAEQAALEAAISLCDELDTWKKEIGQEKEWRPLARYLIQSKKLRLTGSREAPIQVLGLGETGSQPFSKALILPMDQDIFPHKPFRGPYLNTIHTPRIYKAQFEANDLLLRQFLSLCEEVHMAARFDKTNGFAPSSHFAFLATEFEAEVRECFRKPEGFVPFKENPTIPSNEELQQFLLSFQWSFHSLQLFFSCPYHFLLKYKEKLLPPSVLEEGEEAIQLHIGNVLHEWAATLPEHPPALQHWREQFEAIWKEKVGDDRAPGEEYFPLQGIYKPIVLSYLEDIAKNEAERVEHGGAKLLLFADEGVQREQWITATFSSSGSSAIGEDRGMNKTYHLRGRVDRIQPYDGKTLILDLKYKGTDTIRLSPKEASRGLDSYLQEKGSLHEFHQLVVYAYLWKEKMKAEKNDMRASSGLAAAFYALKETDPDKRLIFLPSEEIECLDPHMEQIAGALDDRIAQREFAPNYNSEHCRFCPYRPLCGHPDGLTGGDAW